MGRSCRAACELNPSSTLKPSVFTGPFGHPPRPPLVMRLPQPNINCLAVINISRPHGGAVAIVAPIDRAGRGLSMAFHSRNTAPAAAIAAAILFARGLAYSPLGPAGWARSGLGAAGATAQRHTRPAAPPGGRAS